MCVCVCVCVYIYIYMNHEYNLQQIVTEPTRENNLLDVAIVSSRLHNAVVDVLPPVAGADHKA